MNNVSALDLAGQGMPRAGLDLASCRPRICWAQARLTEGAACCGVAGATLEGLAGRGFLRWVWGRGNPGLGAHHPAWGEGSTPACWVQLGLALASGIWWWVLASWVGPGWAWGSGGELVGCRPAPGLCPACCTPRLRVRAGSDDP